MACHGKSRLCLDGLQIVFAQQARYGCDAVAEAATHVVMMALGELKSGGCVPHRNAGQLGFGEQAPDRPIDRRKICFLAGERKVAGKLIQRPCMALTVLHQCHDLLGDA